MPVSRGGGDEMENLQTLCRVCNARKGTNLEMEKAKV
ncbi:HNH endonuclease [Acinetobacter sp. V117_2]|nr:HNH endonuclease [Acinetobacter sp. V117_2]